VRKSGANEQHLMNQSSTMPMTW